MSCVDHGRKGFGLGYATTWITRNGKRHTTTLHRAIHFKATGEWPEVVRHKCDNPRCINPLHLESGTAKDNMRDMFERGRQGDCRNFGDSNGRTVLSTQDVVEIRRSYVKGCREYGIPALSRRFKIGTSQVWRVIKGIHHAEVN